MAGFLGFGNYAKPGKGVGRDEPQKKRFFYFFDLYFRKLTRLIQLNLLYLLFCLPIITIGPATAAMVKIARYYVEEKPVFLWSDFWEAFKSNFKQGFFVGILSAVLTFAVSQAFIFYYAKSFENGLYWIPLVMIGFLSLLLVFSSFYVYLVMVTVEVNFFALLKNSLMLCFLGAKTNWLTLIFLVVITIPSVFFPIPIMLLFTFSTAAFLICFNSFQYVYEFLIRPYYLANGLEDPYEEKDLKEESIFEDTI